VARKLCLALLVTGTTLLSAVAQENSPFARYGLGNIYNGINVVGRSMGGLGVAYADGLNNNVGQSINFSNPATYGNLYMTSFDLGLMIDSRTLRSNNPSGNFNSKYFIPSYLAIGMPLSRKKGLGLAFGLRPITRINYSVHTFQQIGTDSLANVYEGNGGLNQVFVGLGKKWKSLNIGFHTGYNFGSKDISTKKSFLNDTVFHYQSNSFTNTHFHGLFFDAGIQYEILLNKKEHKETKSTEQYLLRFGATAGLSQKLSATQETGRQTFTQTASGDLTIDSIYATQNVKGKVELPASYAGGVTFHKTTANARGIFEMWSIGAEYAYTQWSKYRFYNQADALVNSWQFKLGGQFSPNPVNGRGYWSGVNYRAGVYFGKDYVNPDGNGLKQFGISLGAGLPIKKWRSYDYQFTTINTAFQFGKRGSSVNNITENYFQLSFGLSLSDIWFQKRKYD
jgi:hypothetical protein